jgi:hypothetical protein
MVLQTVEVTGDRPGHLNYNKIRNLVDELMDSIHPDSLHAIVISANTCAGVITGSVGDPESLNECMEFLKKEIAESYGTSQ